ncbi:DUF4347 domain-containing protein [Rhodobacterales bacterium LSUCC0031]|nr:DUF4347 domain-containing protein [Rhodobacterales bacterium LSUCC0031]
MTASIEISPVQNAVAIDAACAYLDRLIAGIGPSRTANLLDTGRESLRPTAHIFAGHEHVTGLHLSSHGSEGVLNRGKATVTTRADAPAMIFGSTVMAAVPRSAGKAVIQRSMTLATTGSSTAKGMTI